MKNRSFRRWLTLVLVLAMLLGILPAVAAADASLSDYAPAGTTNLAVGATLTVSNGTHNAMGQENSYEMPSEHWSKDFVHDGVLDGQGFSTNPYDSEPDASVQVVLTFDLGRRCSVSKFGVFARAGAIFPTDYQIETSLDGEMWSVAAEQTGAPKDPAEPYFYELDSAVEARYVRLNVTKRYAQDSIGGAGNDGKLVLDHPLTVADLGDGDRSAAGTVEPLAGAELLHHPSKGSLYLNFYYDLGECTPEEVQYLDLLTDILDELDTPEHTARELQTQRATWLGNSMACISFWTGRQEGSPCHAKLTWNMSLLERNLDKAIALGSEYLYKTCLTGPKAEEAFARVLSQQKLNMEQQFIRQGNQYAAVRAAAHYSVEYALSERCSGVTGYHFLCGLLEQADWAAMGKKLEAVREKVLNHAALTVSLHGSEEALAKLRALLPGSAFAAQGRTAAKPYTEVLTAPVNEAFIIDGGVNYDILTWPMERQADRRVLARIMSYEYLWHNIREVGGAYGTGMLTRAQTEGLYTYRDPHLTESYETFAKAPEVLAGREYTEKDLTEFIVGAVSEMDSPKKPNAEAKELDRRYFCGITDAMLAADRKALCSVTAETIRAQAADLADRMANATRVAFGSKDAVEAGKQLFDRIETL